MSKRKGKGILKVSPFSALDISLNFVFVNVHDWEDAQNFDQSARQIKFLIFLSLFHVARRRIFHSKVFYSIFLSSFDFFFYFLGFSNFSLLFFFFCFSLSCHRRNVNENKWVQKDRPKAYRSDYFVTIFQLISDSIIMTLCFKTPWIHPPITSKQNKKEKSKTKNETRIFFPQFPADNIYQLVSRRFSRWWWRGNEKLFFTLTFLPCLQFVFLSLSLRNNNFHHFRSLVKTDNVT